MEHGRTIVRIEPAPISVTTTRPLAYRSLADRLSVAEQGAGFGPKRELSAPFGDGRFYLQPDSRRPAGIAAWANDRIKNHQIKMRSCQTGQFVALDRPRPSACFGAGPLRTAAPRLQRVVGSRASALLSVVPLLPLLVYVGPVGTPGRLRGIPEQRSPERWRARAPRRSMSARSSSGERTSAAPK